MTQQVVKARVGLLDSITLQDNISMSMYFEATGSDANIDFGTAETPQTAIAGFFNSVTTGQTNALALYVSKAVSRGTNACSIQWTDITAHLDGTPAGAAFRTDTFTLSAGSTGLDLPGQVAACCAYRAAYGTDLEHGAGTVSLPSSESAQDQGAPATHLGTTRPRARDRGRFFFGPVNAAAVGTNGIMLAQFLTDLSAALALLTTTFNSGGANQFNMVQWSRRNAQVKPIGLVYVDEGWATQRRRQDTTTNRVHSWVIN